MKIVTTFHHPSSIVGAVKCRLSTTNTEHLVVAKLNRVDVYSLRPSGSHLECGIDIWGKVTSLKALPIPGSPCSNLLLLLGHPDPELIVLSLDEPAEGQSQLAIRKQLSLYERYRSAEFFNDIIVHPSGKVVVASCYAGKLKVVSFRGGIYVQDFDISLPELNVLHMTFLHTDPGTYTLAILHIDNVEKLQLLSRDILLDQSELSSTPSTLLAPTLISLGVLPLEYAPILIPIPPPENPEDEDFYGGVLVVGGKRLLLYGLASPENQSKQQGKRRRLEARKQSSDRLEAKEARGKERQRELRKRKTRATVEWPWGSITAWCTIDRQRYLLGDSFGYLSLLSFDRLHKTGLMLLPLGESSSPTCFAHLSGQTLFLGSHTGDSHILEIARSPLSGIGSPTLTIHSNIKTVSPEDFFASLDDKGKALDLDGDVSMEDKDISKGTIFQTKGSLLKRLESFKNIAPIIDAIVVDLDESGQKHIVTCSGGRNTGSLNVIRNGTDFQELAVTFGINDIANLWTSHRHYEGKLDTHLIISTLQSTRILRIDDAGLVPKLVYLSSFSSPGVSLNEATIAFANIKQRDGKLYVNSTLAVQVTPRGVYLLNWDMTLSEYVRLDGWRVDNQSAPGTRPTEIVAASINASQILVAITGARLFSLKVVDGTIREVLQSELEPGAEISAISARPLDPSMSFSIFIPISFWERKDICIYQFTQLGFSLTYRTPPLPALVRSLLFVNFGMATNTKSEDYRPYLLAGLADGSLVTYVWKDGELKDRKIITLGHTPVTLTPCIIDGRSTVFAAGNRAMVLSWDKKKLSYSPIMLKDVVAATTINTRSFDSALALATPNGLHIGRVRDVGKMHIRTIPLGLDNPRRITYQRSLKVFGVACSRTVPVRVGQDELSTYNFKLFNDGSFVELCQYTCETSECITAVAAMSPTPSGSSDGPVNLFCLGTYKHEDSEREPTKGRLILLSVHDATSQELHVVTTRNVDGCVYALTIVGSFIVAAVNSAVRLFQLVLDKSSASFTLQQIHEWNHSYIVTNLTSVGNHIVVGDAMNSVSILIIQDEKLQTLARDYAPMWPIAVEAFDENNVIAANDALNFLTYTLTKVDGRMHLERNGEFHLGDLVTKFIRDSLVTSEVSGNRKFDPELIFCTSTGRIGVIIGLEDEQVALQLTALQRNLGCVIEGVGGTSHSGFRAPKTLEKRSGADIASFGFLDGDYLEHFLTLLSRPPLVQKVLDGRNEPERILARAENFQAILEQLQSLH